MLISLCIFARVFWCIFAGKKPVIVVGYNCGKYDVDQNDKMVFNYAYSQPTQICF